MFKKLFNHRKQLAAVMLSACMITGTMVPMSVFADTAGTDQPTSQTVETTESNQQNEPVQTTVKGYARLHNRTLYNKTMTDTIRVEPAYGRILSLYHYDYTNKVWLLDSTYVTDDAYSSRVKLTFNDYWKTRNRSAYKIVMDEVPANGQSNTSSLDGTMSKDEMNSRGASGLSVKMHTNFNPVKAATAVVMNADTHEIVFQKYANTRRKVSSLTKMMTAILLREEFTLGHKVKITNEAARTPWGIGLKAGDTMTTRNLLYAMLLPSANDAACASGIAVGGTTGEFADMMNARAEELGCTRTVYENAHGLDTSGNYSTAKDQALIGSYIMTEPDMSYLRKVVTVKKKTIYSGKKRKYTLYNSNALLGTGTFKGLKTGTTTLGGYSFCGAFEVNGQTYISVVLGSTSGAQRFTDTRNLAGLTEELKG